MESFISKFATSEISFFLASLCRLGDLFESQFVENPEDRLCRVEAKIIPLLSLQSFNFIQTFIYAFGIVMFVFEKEIQYNFFKLRRISVPEEF